MLPWKQSIFEDARCSGDSNQIHIDNPKPVQHLATTSFFFFLIGLLLWSSHSPAVVMPKHSTSNIQAALKNRKQGEALTFSQVWNVSFHESIIFRALHVSSTGTALGLPKTWIICWHIKEELEPWLSWIWKSLGCSYGLFCRVFVGGFPRFFLQNEWDTAVRAGGGSAQRRKRKANCSKNDVALQTRSGKTKNTPSARPARIGYHEEPVCMVPFFFNGIMWLKLCVAVNRPMCK